ncbi:MAG: transglutaminase-like domain-containing protein, partial [Acidobacteria bacterium]|nr:transglutaminase-like domain-containing protein [Acidobacteriota bacterium]
MDHTPEIGLFDEINSLVKSNPNKIMPNEGIAGAAGGIHLKAFKKGVYYIRIPIPQLTESQCPVFYSLTSNPETSLIERKIQEDKEGNCFLNLKFNVEKNQEIYLKWSSAILLKENGFKKNCSKPDIYLVSTPCVQSASKAIKELSEKLFPSDNDIKKYAKNIRDFIKVMSPKGEPKSLDAIEILKSGNNFICTSNANLTAALFRAKNIPARTVATLPVISSPFEMHMIVDYYDKNKGVSFDPSGVFEDLPLKPYQNVIMAKTTIEDEEKSMKLRAGSMAGCPFGQEAEFSNLGLNLFGEDFFWTTATPLAEFFIDNETAKQCQNLWEKFLKTGNFNEKQKRAA